MSPTVQHPGIPEQRLTFLSITIALGIAVIFVLPDFPDTWKRLSPELKAVANRRLAIDAAEADVDIGGNMSHWTGAKLAFKDPKTYLLAFMYHCVCTMKPLVLLREPLTESLPTRSSAAPVFKTSSRP